MQLRMIALCSIVSTMQQWQALIDSCAYQQLPLVPVTLVCADGLTVGGSLQNLGGKQSDVRFTPAANMVFQTAKLDSPNIGEPQPELKEVRSLGFRVSLSCAAATDLQSVPCTAMPR